MPVHPMKIVKPLMERLLYAVNLRVDALSRARFQLNVTVMNAIVAQMIISVVMENAYLSVRFVHLAQGDFRVRLKTMVAQMKKNFAVHILIPQLIVQNTINA